MSKTSPIRHAENTFVALLREDYMAICQDDHCAAMVLSQMEHWHIVKMDARTQAQAHNTAAVKSGKQPTQDEELWVYKSHEEMYTELRKLFGVRAIGTAFINLVKWGYLATRSNPNYTWDKTKQYLLQVPAINKAILLAFSEDRTPDPDVFETSTAQDGDDSSAHSDVQERKTPKNTTKTTVKEDKQTMAKREQSSVVVDSRLTPVSNTSPELKAALNAFLPEQMQAAEQNSHISISDNMAKQPEPIAKLSELSGNPGQLPPTPESETVSLLRAAGITATTAQELVTKYGSVRCRRHYDRGEWKGKPKPGGWLRTAIVEDYQYSEQNTHGNGDTPRNISQTPLEHRINIRPKEQGVPPPRDFKNCLNRGAKAE